MYRYTLLMSTRIQALLTEDEIYKTRILADLETTNDKFIEKLREHDEDTGLDNATRCNEILEKLRRRDVEFVKEKLGIMYQLLTGLRDNVETQHAISPGMIDLLVAQTLNVNSRIVDSYIKVKVEDWEDTFQLIKNHDARILAELNQ
jgi:hypothetical protein